MVELQHADPPLLVHKVSETPNVKWNDGNALIFVIIYLDD